MAYERLRFSTVLVCLFILPMRLLEKKEKRQSSSVLFLTSLSSGPSSVQRFDEPIMQSQWLQNESLLSMVWCVWRSWHTWWLCKIYVLAFFSFFSVSSIQHHTWRRVVYSFAFCFSSTQTSLWCSPNENRPPVSRPGTEDVRVSNIRFCFQYPISPFPSTPNTR